MDIDKLWADFVSALPRDWPSAVDQLQIALSNPLARAIGLLIIVWSTIWVIARIYSGDKQGAKLGPVAIRAHQGNRYKEDTIRLPKDLLDPKMDGIIAGCEVYYSYVDANGITRNRRLRKNSLVTLSVSPTKVKKAGRKIDGQEIPDVPTARVCFPDFEATEPVDPIPPMASRAPQYAELHSILDSWTDDDAALLIAVGQEFMDDVETSKVQFIKEEIEKIERADRPVLGFKPTFKRRYRNRPNVVGSYYLKLRFSQNPAFVLMQHPDRDVKMTAWLTVLTSVFALIMDAWPKAPAAREAVTIAEPMPNAPAVRATVRAPAIPPS